MTIFNACQNTDAREVDTQATDDLADTMPSRLPNYPLVVLDAREAVRYDVIVDLLHNPQTAYLRLVAGAGSEPQILAQIRRACVEQGAVLAELRALILDEADHADAETLAQALRVLIAQHPQLRIIVVARQITRSLLMQPILQGVVSAYPPIVVHASQQPHTLSVDAYGRGRVWLDSQAVLAWDGALPRNLFFFLVDRGMATRNEIFAIFWPNMSVKEATNVFHVTKRKIGELLQMDLTIYSSGYYCIAPTLDLRYDVRRFAHLVQQGEIAQTPQVAIKLLQEAIEVARSAYLVDVRIPWFVERRRQLRQALSDALMLFAQSWHRLGDDELALSLLLRATVSDLGREDIVQRVMALYHNRGMTAQALQVYERLRAYLQDVRQQTPNAKLTAYAQKIRDNA